MTGPTSPQNVLADWPRSRQYTPIQPTSRLGEIGYVTLQPLPASSHSRFSFFLSSFQ